MYIKKNKEKKRKKNSEKSWNDHTRLGAMYTLTIPY